MNRTLHTFFAAALAVVFATSVASAALVGVTVNGVELDDTGSNGPGWTYAAPTLTLTNAGPYTISGENTAGGVCVVVAAGVTSEVTLSDLTLVTTNKNQCVFTLETNAVVSLFLAGTNTLASGYNRAGLEVAAGRTLSITNAPGDASGALTANGGETGAGIGGGNGGACGTVTINGGIVTANGSEFFGAGIGGGAGGGGGTVTINGGIVTANGSEFFGAGIGGGAGGGGGTVTISGGAVMANGGEMGAGIGSGGYAGSDGGTVNISGGAVTATGGNWSAGIGGGDGDAGGTVNISGGIVTATGGQYGAGIGGGNNDSNPDGIAGTGGTVNISGGRVTATGGKCAAGIGGGTGQELAGSAGAALSVSGGTVFAIGGAGGAPGVGGGLGNVGEGDTGDAPDISGSNHFTGGSIRIDGDFAMAAPSNGTARVWCVTVPDLTPDAAITVTSLDPYGVNDLFSDGTGKLYLWLPNNTYNFTAGSTDYGATVSDANTTATPQAPPAPSAYLTFSSADEFSIRPQTNSWNGTLECSTDAANWALFTTNGAAATTNASGEFKLYVRGTSNTVMTGDAKPGWLLNATGPVACSGNIETLLDYATVAAGQHPAMTNGCFAHLFDGWTNLTEAPGLPATNLASSCYENMFYRCASLTNAPALPASNLAASCYEGMFFGCTGLTAAPVLPATNLASSCYENMFFGCAGLTNTPALPAITMAERCYVNMFSRCMGLTNAPALPATELAPFCYYFMFYGCTGLTNAPALPATTMADWCYAAMFQHCANLTEAPALPATNLASSCYGSMFGHCTALTRLPALPAMTLADSCYHAMFYQCAGITLYENGTGPTWGIPAGAQEALNWNADMLTETGGTFTNTPVIGATYYYAPPAPSAYLTFSSTNAFTITPKMNSWNGTLEYSTDATTWEAFTTNGAAAATNAAGDYNLYLRGTSNTVMTGDAYTSGWKIAATGTVACIGNIETLLDYETVAAGQHPAMANGCFANLFYSWTNLTAAPTLPATNLAEYCYLSMFYRCTGLTNAPALPASTLAANCYEGMFFGCTGLTNAPALPATNLAASCYLSMFNACTGLTEAPDLPAMNMLESCYSSMFSSCKGLANAPALPATHLADSCYTYMFYKCPGLTNAPALPATDLTNDCYRAMFHGCSGLTTPPELPATNLAESCYQNMFAGCTGLTNAPALPAANLLYSCYFSMFRECTGLTEAPELPATTLAAQCYAEMFAACTGLTNAPALPAANLADNCYSYMFRGCTGLTRLPELSAINLAPYCYAGMFDSCTGIMLSEDGTGPTWSIPEDATPAAGWNTNMLVETGGAFTGDPVIGATYYYTAPPPSFSNAHLTFTSDEAFSITPQVQSWQGTLEYSTDAANWAAFTTGGAAAATNASGKYLLYLRGTSNTCMTGYARPGWLLNATGPVACSGNIETLLDYTTVAAGQHPAMADFCFAGLFMDWTNLTEAPDLPATNLTPSCYRATFSGCGNLTTAPELPATTLASHCYYFMFFACPGLTNAPALPATDLADNCYENMFRSCTGLTKAPDLPATNLAVWCYGNMFNGCRALTQAPALPAATLPNSCYVGMFQDCRALTNAPALPATNLLFQCYANMFRGCTSLTEAPDLPAMNLAGSCYKSMFHGCTGLTRVPELPATNLLRSCYEAMFKNCTGITLYKDGSGPPWGIPAGAQAQEDWNLDMFAGTSGLFTGNPAIGVTYYHAPPLASEAHLTFTSDDAFSIAPKMNSWNGTLECSTDAATWALFTTNGAAAATNASGEFKLYVRGTSNTIITGSFETPGWRMDGADAIACSGNIETLLDYQTVAAGQHPLMADYCFANLFREWTNLTATPTLPATTLTEACYLYMFKNCASLTEAPELPASTLAYGCYYGMFESCAGLTQTPALSAMNLAEGCYGSMFEGCTALTNAPALPATTLTDWCYCCMFRNCTSLMDTPALPARTVMESSYNSMFHGCTRLRKLPELPATNLALNCYYSMFRSCTGIKLSATGPGTPWGIPANAKEQEDWNLEMFTDTGGPFTGRPGIGVTYYYDSTPPSPPPGGYIAFVSEGAFSITPREESWNGTLECSTDAVTWAPFTTNGATAAPNDARDYLLYLRGTSNTCVTGQNKPGWNINAPEEAFCFGNIENLLDYETVANGLHPAMDAWCFANLFNGCSDLAKAPELPAMTLSDSCYNGMFFYCTRLKRAPELPATNLSSYCYSSMFYGCMWLKEAPELPAMNLAEYCYAAMFSECLSLTNAPALPATTLANYGYGDMFTDCTGLTRLPELPATNLAEYCYQNMFAGCSGIALHANGTAPTWGIPADATEKTGWNTGMLAETGGTFTGDPAIGAIYHYSPLPAPGAYLTFSSTNPFTITPKFDSLEGALSASTDALNWVEFTTNGAAAADNGSGEYRLYICGWGNSRIPAGHYQPGWAIDAPTGTVACSGNIETLLDHEKVAAGKHPAMANWCFMDLFQMCTALASAPELPAETLSQGCYYGMFCACTGLTNAPALPATNLANFCYHQMFAECPNLTTAPALPATHLADYCYHAMFAECTGLTNAPELPATTMAECSYQHMFFRCTGLTSAPELPATNLAQQCYAGMFRGCTALTSPPALPATTMAFAAYVEMFRGCTALTNTPALPATNLMSFCYEYMFEGCTGLTRLPELPATDLAYHGYAEMFRNCTGIKLYENGTGPTWGIPAGATEKTGWNEDMLVGTGGAFTNDPVIGATYYYAPPPAPGACLTFSSANTFTITPWVQSWNGALHASTDGTNWVPFTTNGATAADNGSGEYRLYLCGWGNSHITGAEDAPGWTINAEMGTVACAGNIETLLDHTKVAAGEHPAMDDWCFANLFQNCAALTSPPDLPATNLAPACYHTIFYRCTALTNAPELPATTLAEDCYLGMFADCAALKNAPELPATNLAEYCYTGMFYGCKQLRNPPKLPATNLAQNCYEIMFADCMRLRNAPELPATTLTQACYQNMFWGCEGLTTLPKLPATNLAENCYSGMFRDCTSIKLNATGPGTPWGIPESAQAATNWNTEMLVGTSGAFTNDPVIGAIYYHQALPPPPAPGAHLTFSSPDAFTISPEKKGWDGTVQYSTDATNWSEFTIAGAEAATNSAGEFRLYICGTSNTCIAKWEEDLFGWELAANGPVACAGNIETLLDHPQVTAGEHPAMADSCFAALFHDWTALTSAPELPATNLTESCYRATFYGCTGLTEAPVLPATTMARDCYLGMFAGCAALTNAPGLPATDLAETCYEYMFQDCTALTNAPALPATTLANNCYRGMFRNCTALKKAPALPATNLTVYCYHIMFQGCTALTTPPELPATTLTNHCYAHMFRDCTALTKLPVLPATNLACCCYVGMFGDCINIRLNTEGPGTPWGIPESATAAPDWNNGMFTGTGGPFTDDPVIGVTYYLNSAPFFPADGSLVFDGTTLTIKITNAESGLWYTLYSLDNLLEETWTKIESLQATGSELTFTINLGTPAEPRLFFKVVATPEKP